jgi:hypothetical protein
MVRRKGVGKGIETMCDIEKAYEYSISYLDSGDGMKFGRNFCGENKRQHAPMCMKN